MNTFKNSKKRRLSLVGLGAAALIAGNAEAAISWSGDINHTLSGTWAGAEVTESFPIDIDGDGIAEFDFKGHINQYGSTSDIKLTSLEIGSGAAGVYDNKAINYTKFLLGVTIDNNMSFKSDPIEGRLAEENSKSGSKGNWNPTPTRGFAAVIFDFAGNNHYGWVDITVTDVSSNSPGFSATLHSYAWETSPGVGISAGDVGVDADGDGVNSAIESAVPDADGSGTGDGNNDGTADTTQAYVSSLKTNDGNNYVTLDNTNGLNLTAVSASPAPANLPTGVTLPYGMVGFTVNGVANGATVSMDIFYPYNPAINGFWKKGNDGAWHNVSTSISHIGTTKTKITISLVEGGNFDTDGANNNTLTDPGGAGVGAGANAIPTLSEWMLILLSLTLGFFSAIKIRSPQREDLMFK